MAGLLLLRVLVPGGDDQLPFIGVGTNAVVLDETTGQTYAPDSAGIVTLPSVPAGDVTIIGRGVNAKLLESFRFTT